MADSTFRVSSPSNFPLQLHRFPLYSYTLPSLSSKPPFPFLTLRLHSNSQTQRLPTRIFHVRGVQDAIGGAVSLIQSSPPTWQSALLSNFLIFVLGSPILASGLSLSGIGAAFLLGTLTWRAFGPSGFLLVAAYFVVVGTNFL